MHTKASDEKNVGSAGAGAKGEGKDKDLVETGNMTFKQNMRVMWKKYGLLFVGTYFGLWAGTFTGMVACLEGGLFSASAFGVDPVDAVRSMSKFADFVVGNDSCSSYIQAHPKAGTFVVALAMTKVTEIARVPVVFFITPNVARLIGWQPKGEGAAAATVEAEKK